MPRQKCSTFEKNPFIFGNSHSNEWNFLNMNLKKNYKRLSDKQPDCCADCPLIGIIPEGKREGKWTHVCCATGDAMTRVGIRVIASAKDAKHPWHRSCDGIWEEWWSANPHHLFKIPLDRYITWRQPYEFSLGLKINFPKRWIKTWNTMSASFARR